MTQILELAQEAGVATFPTYQDGNSILVYGGKRIVYGAEDPHSLGIPVPEADLNDFMTAVTEIDKLSREVPSQTPWEAPRAREFDYQTVESWMQQNLATDGAKFALRSVVAGYFAVEACDLSVLHLLFYVAAAGGVEALEESSLAWRFDGGAQEIPNRLAERLGDSISLDTAVRQIDQTGDTVIVETDAGPHAARRVIMAVSPALAARISYRPSLPASRDQYTQRAPLGSVVKCHAVYPTAYWRQDGLNGQLVSEEDVNSVFDNSPPGGNPGILVGFIEGEAARRWADRPEAATKWVQYMEGAVRSGQRAAAEVHDALASTP